MHMGIYVTPTVWTNNYYILYIYRRLKTKMEPEHHPPFEKEKYLPDLHFWASM